MGLLTLIAVLVFTPGCKRYYQLVIELVNPTDCPDMGTAKPKAARAPVAKTAAPKPVPTRADSPAPVVHLPNDWAADKKVSRDAKAVVAKLRVHNPSGACDLVEFTARMKCNGTFSCAGRRWIIIAGPTEELDSGEVAFDGLFAATMGYHLADKHTVSLTILLETVNAPDDSTIIIELLDFSWKDACDGAYALTSGLPQVGATLTTK